MAVSQSEQSKLQKNFVISLNLALTVQHLEASPLACSAANAVLDVIENENLINKAEENGAYLYSELNKLAVKYSDLIEQVRGKGLMLAIELKNETGRLIEILRENRLLVVGAAETQSDTSLL